MTNDFGDRVEICAFGRVHPTGPNETVHHEPLRPNYMRVQIEQIVDGCGLLPLPVPTKDFDVLSRALCSFVQWPNKNIILGEVISFKYQPYLFHW